MPLMMGSRTIISVMISDGISAAALSPLSIAAGLYSTGIFTLEIEKDKTEKIIYSNWKKYIYLR